MIKLSVSHFQVVSFDSDKPKIKKKNNQIQTVFEVADWRGHKLLVGVGEVTTDDEFGTLIGGSV